MNGSAWCARAERSGWGSGCFLGKGMSWLQRSSREALSVNGAFALILPAIFLNGLSAWDMFRSRLTFRSRTDRQIVSVTRPFMPVKGDPWQHRLRDCTLHQKFCAD